MKLRTILSLLAIMLAVNTVDAKVLVKNDSTYPIVVRMHWYGPTAAGDSAVGAAWDNEDDKPKGPIGTFKTSNLIQPGRSEWIFGDIGNVKSRWQVKIKSGAGATLADWPTVIDTDRYDIGVGHPISSAGDRILTIGSKADLRTGQEKWKYDDRLTAGEE